MGEFPVLDGQLFLFQGDSITDCGRRYEARPYGSGYAWLFSELVTAAFPERSIRYINKGIGGDRTTGLRERWEDDVIVHQPDWVSILIGINDLHSYLGDPVNGTSVEIYRAKYDSILATTREKTSAQIVLLDPFYISADKTGAGFRSVVLDLLPQYIAVVDEMAAKYETLQVKTHDLFQKHLQYRDADTFCPEPVHPNHAGHLVMAKAMFRALKAGKG
jgi:lysophospholipase L1-like esterase